MPCNCTINFDHFQYHFAKKKKIFIQVSFANGTNRQTYSDCPLNCVNGIIEYVTVKFK